MKKLFHFVLFLLPCSSSYRDSEQESSGESEEASSDESETESEGESESDDNIKADTTIDVRSCTIAQYVQFYLS